MTLEKNKLRDDVAFIIRQITGEALNSYFNLYEEGGYFLERSIMYGMCIAVSKATDQVLGWRFVPRSTVEENHKDKQLVLLVGHYLGSQIEEFDPYKGGVGHYWKNDLEGVEIRVGILSAFRECSELLAKDFLNSSYAEGLK